MEAASPASAERPALGIDIGLISVKATLVRGGQEQWTEIVCHEGDIADSLRGILARHGVEPGLPAVTTGNAGRNQVRTAQIIPPQAIEAGIARLCWRPDAVVALGGESIVVYTLSEAGLTREAITGDKCAAGTGEFFRQQLGRMDLGLDVLDRIPDETSVHALSSRCSVFMKSDCTHKLNKREATKEEIVVSLADVMAGKVAEFLVRARVESGRVLLIGGVTQNRFFRQFVARRLPGVTFEWPREAAYFEAYGAALTAAEHGTPLPPLSELIDEAAVTFERSAGLRAALGRVSAEQPRRAAIREDGTYVLGIDGGSTTTKAVLVDADTREICASHYGRTHGDPVEALRRVLREIRGQVREALGEGGEARIRIPLCAATGSSREVLGVFTETAGIYNEIIAHTVGATHFDPDIDTIFEIGGQDAKYVLIKNEVPIDYAMNEACSAGTGSFLEESAMGDLNIRSVEEIGPIALQSNAPLHFGEHCSAFINSDIRKAIQEGATKPDIVAGIVLSVVSNYLNRVVGNRAIGGHIVLQGGVAKNPAVPAAFASVLGQPILVPPDPELLGAFGVALLALQKRDEGLLSEGAFDLSELIARPIEHGKVFACKSCENLCPIRTILVGQGRARYFFGGRCNQWANARRKRKIEIEKVDDYVALRERMLFVDYAPDPAAFRPRTTVTVGIPRAFSVHSLWPLYAWFFHQLGVRTVLSETSRREGVQRAESAYCLPGEIAHGMTQDLIERGVDLFFLPHLQNMHSMEEGVPATLCPLTQGLPYYLRPAFDLPDSRILRPVIDFAGGYSSGSAPFIDMAERLGFSKEEGLDAFRVAMSQQVAFAEHCRELGAEILERAREGLGKGPGGDDTRGDDTVLIALFGRPYNAFAPEANMGVPRKFLTRGYRVLPYDFFPVSDEDMSPNMYWYYGQQNMKAARMVKEHPGVFLCYMSNFGCAPDSFMLHFVRWFMGTKPYLVLEMDSHTADAGIDTRIEAFLDIIAGYRRKAADMKDRPYRQRYEARLAGEDTRIIDHQTGEELPLKHPRVRLVWPSMGSLSAEVMDAICNHLGFRATHMDVADRRTVQVARAVASGKECIPTLMVLGQLFKLEETLDLADDEVLAVIVPKTTGPCRTGQYGPFYERTLSDLGIQNVAILNLCSDNGYMELGPSFTKLAWYAIVLGDVFRDIENALKVTAADPGAAQRVFREVWSDVLQIVRTDITGLYPYLEREGVPRLAAVPRARRLEDVRKVIVVGEIYVRRDDFSTEELVDRLAAAGIFPKITGVGEWIFYCDHSHERMLGEKLARRPWYRRVTSEGFGTWAGLKVEQAVMRAIEERVKGIVAPAGLSPEFPHDIREVLRPVDTFTHLAFETEATVSTLVATQAAEQGYDGIVAMAPFACLPGRLIKAMLEPHCRKHGIPLMTIEADGQRFPPNVISRLEIFALNVLRRGKGEEAAGGGVMLPGIREAATVLRRVDS